ncbi:MAG TPA: TrmB family transcriptional regulator [Candidatus Pacearchaeota archaeon]|nr:sugar-specific transcriptional regulator TrmB [archaeon BMS3Abin17]HDK42675.1 TrmB family transcriptional regulator [Candidatus Pacearchaeota archaeon]HDZ61380.1 TrmB family transcriptional regulator [Candidatus Pacearchaeota archaeon]
MLVKQELINKIKDYFDLNIYETKVWLALLGKGIASAGQIADISGVPRSRTYDVLESLEKKGFAIVKIGKPVRYIGVKPRMILEKLKNNVRKDAEDRIVSLGGIKETEEFSMLEVLYKEGIDPVKREDISAALKGKSNISNYLREVLQNAKKEVIICTNAEEINSKTKLFQQTFEILKKSNIKLKFALSGDESLINQIEKKFGMKIKRINIDAKFFIVDRGEILFYLSKNSDKEDTAIWLNSEFFVEAFASLFEKAMGEK